MNKRAGGRRGRRLKLFIIVAAACVAQATYFWIVFRDGSDEEPNLCLVRPVAQHHEQYPGLDNPPFLIRNNRAEYIQFTRFDPHGELIAIDGGMDFEPFQAIDIRELASGRLINRIVADMRVHQVGFSHCQQYLAVCSEMPRSVAIYHVKSGELLWVAMGRARIGSFAFACQGRIAVADKRGTIALFDLQTGDQLWETAPETDPGMLAMGTHILQASGDGQKLLAVQQNTSEKNSFARILQLSDGSELNRTTIPWGSYRNLAPSPDGLALYFLRVPDQETPKTAEVARWDLSAAEPTETATVKVTFPEGRLSHLRLAQATQDYLFFYASTPMGTLFVADRNTGEILQKLTGNHMFSRAFAATPDGRMATVTTRNSVRLLEVATGRVISHFKPLRTASRPYGRNIVFTESGRWAFFPAGSVLRAINLQNHDYFSSSIEYYHHTTARDRGSSAVVLMTHPLNNRIFVGQPAGQGFETLLEIERELQCAELGAAGDYLLLGSRNQITRVTLEGEEVYSRPANNVSLVKASPNGERFVSVEDRRTVVLRNSGDGEIIDTLGRMDRQVSLVSFNAESTKVAAADKNGTIQVWDLTSGEAVGAITMPHEPLALCLSGSLVATIGQDSSHVEFRDMHTGAMTRRLGGHEGLLRAMAISPGGERLTAASNFHNITTWDMLADERLRVDGFHGRQELVTQAMLQSDDRGHITFVATFNWSRSRDTRLNVLIPFRDIHSGQLLAAKPGFYPAHPFADGEQYIGMRGGYQRRWVFGAFPDAISSRGYTMRMHNQPNIAFPSPDYRNVYIMGDSNERFRLPEWEKSPLHEPVDSPLAYALSADGEYVALGFGTRPSARGRRPPTVPRPANRATGRPVGSVSEYTFADDGLSPSRALGNFSAAITALSYSPQGTYLLVGCQNGKVYVISRQTGATVWGIDAHASSVYSMAFGPEERYLATKGRDYSPRQDGSRGGPMTGVVRIWDMEQRSIASETWVFNDQMHSHLYIHPSGRYFIGGSTGRGRRIQFRSFPEANHLGTLIMFKDLHWIFYTPDGRYDGSREVEEKLIIQEGNFSKTESIRRVSGLIDQALGPR